MTLNPATIAGAGIFLILTGIFYFIVHFTTQYAFAQPIMPGIITIAIGAVLTFIGSRLG